MREHPVAYAGQHRPRGGTMFRAGMGMFTRGRFIRRPARHCKRIFCVAVVAAAGLAGLVTPVAASATASLASLYLTPSTGSPNVGDELDVQIRVNTGAQLTNAVQANFTYPSSQLSVVGFDNSNTSFP